MLLLFFIFFYSVPNEQYELTNHQKSKTRLRRQESEENTGQSSNSMLVHGQSLVGDTGVSSTSSICQAPLRRQFSESGTYDGRLGSKVPLQSMQLYSDSERTCM
ncbi:hypothetical protein CFOL_v3_24381 [Cephalotus follicularis]|uniref:Uncharacterized protein n=1 Tax=Cephalotus follicularis TaxID=3775 RepID=A0A1Q3CLE0_CEPFO|nr:hypothetical protein CFOL_v3_24381 [Cephalotus follicularis]